MINWNPYRNATEIQKLQWSKNSSKKTSLQEENAQDMGIRSDYVEFFRNFTLHCYRWLVESQINGWQRLIWFMVHIAGVLTIVLVLSTAYEIYTVHSTVTALYNTLYPVKSVPFPGISICNNNRIALSAAVAYAQKLSALNVTNSTFDYFLHNIRNFGRLLDTGDLDGNEDTSAFQAFLNKYDTNESYDTTANMKRLSPSCSEMLIRCIWRGVERPCMQQQFMFDFRSTQYGFCCTFNYVRPDLLKQVEPSSYYIDDTGPDRGLILLLNGSANDYYYPLYNFMGFMVQVFNPNEFPDVPSGSVSERLVGLGYESFIRIDSTTLLTDNDTKRFSHASRGCLFADDLSHDFGGRYKRSDCVVNCRINSIKALCNCHPYYLPITNQQLLDKDANSDRSVPRCTLEHMLCLNQYRIKWSTVLLQLTKVIGLERELEDGLYCPQCLPSCSETTYKVTSQELPLIQSMRKYPTLMTDVHNISEVALVRIFLGQPETWLYKQSASTKWYEIVSNLGGTCGVITGFAIISVAEVLYFLIKQIIRRCLQMVYSDNQSSVNSDRNVAEKEMVLHMLP